MAQNDQALIDRLCSGDHTAFFDLVGRYKKKIYHLAYDITGDHHEAEDISQEVFMKVYRALKTFRQDAKMNSWLHQITVNASIDSLRRKSARHAKSTAELDNVSIQGNLVASSAQNFDPLQSAESAQIQNRISQALQKISPKERTVFVMCHYNGLKLNETAEILNVTTGTVKSLLFRAIRKLRKELSPFMNEYPMEIPHE
jgi:RNA polymerase sigma-70 factor (ECF subfamily)